MFFVDRIGFAPNPGIIFTCTTNHPDRPLCSSLSRALPLKATTQQWQVSAAAAALVTRAAALAIPAPAILRPAPASAPPPRSGGRPAVAPACAAPAERWPA